MAGEIVVGKISSLLGDGDVLIVRSSGERVIAKAGDVLLAGDTLVASSGSKALISLSGSQTGFALLDSGLSAKFDNVLFDSINTLLANSAETDPVNVGTQSSVEVARIFNEVFPDSGLVTASQSSETETVINLEEEFEPTAAGDQNSSSSPPIFSPTIISRSDEEMLPDAGLPTVTDSNDDIQISNETGTVPSDTIPDTISDITSDITPGITVNGNPPTITVTASAAIAEGSAAGGALVASFLATDQEDGTPSVDFTPGTNADGYYVINGTDVELTPAGAAFVNGGGTLPPIDLTATDTSGLTAGDTDTPTVIAVNDAPEITVTAVTGISENGAVDGTVVASFLATDEEDGTPTVDFTPGTNADGYYVINGTDVELTPAGAAFVNGGGTLPPVDLTATDTGGLTADNADTPTVIAENDAPEVTVTAVTGISENSAVVGTVAANFVATDEEDGTPTVDFTPGTNTDGYYVINGTTVELTAAGAAFVNGGGTLPPVDLTATDTSGLTGNNADTPTVTAENDAPVLSPLTAGTFYVMVFKESDSDNIPNDVYLHLAEVEAYDGSTQLTLANATQSSTFGAQFTADKAINGSTAGNPGDYTHTGFAQSGGNAWWQAELTLAEGQTIDSIKLYNRSDDSQSRTKELHIMILTEDLSGVSNLTLAQAQEKAVSQFFVEDPVDNVGFHGDGTSYSMPSYAVFDSVNMTDVETTLSITDEDDSNLEAATVTVSGGVHGVTDTLSFADTANIAGSFNSGDGVMTLSGTDTVAAYKAALESISYSNSNGNVLTAARVLSWRANDGDDDSNLITSVIAPDNISFIVSDDPRDPADVNHNDPNDTIVGTATHDVIYGGTGSDTITGGHGSDVLFGYFPGDSTDDSASDTFVWGLGDQGGGSDGSNIETDVVGDFTVGSGGDVLNLSDLLLGESSASVGDYITLTDNGHNTTLSIDVNGDGNGTDLMIDLVGVTGVNLTTLLNDGNIVIDT